MPNIFKRLARPKAEPYQFPDASELVFEELPGEEPAAEAAQPESSQQETQSPQEEPTQNSQEPIQYAQFQAESIVQDAYRQAEEILSRARMDAAIEAEKIHEAARGDGFRDGYAQGLEQAMAESAEKLKSEAEAQAAEVERFLKKAGEALDKQLDDNVEELRDLALAVAEKIICISLKSSAEVIGRMIQTAVDKRKRREWVHIYIAECDAKRLTPIPASLSASLASLSDRVRIIPMADDESGTCIIEMPNEIIDASTGTQMNNIRALLSDTPSSGSGNYLF